MSCAALETPMIEDHITPVVQPTTKPRPPLQLNRTQLIQAISWIMDDIIRARGNLYTEESKIPNKTIFHAKTLPSIGIYDYITRFVEYTKCQETVLLLSMIYLDKIGELIKDFSLDSFNVHKILLVTMTAASKFSEDDYFTNKYYASVGGVPVKEFQELEEEYLVNWLQFNLYVKSETYEAYYNDIVHYYEDKMSQKKAKGI